MKRRALLTLSGVIATTTSAGCVTWFSEETGPIDIEIVNTSNSKQNVSIRVYDEEGDAVLNNSYEIDARGNESTSVPTIVEKGFTKATNGDSFTVSASIQPDGQREGTFEITCIGRERTRDVFFIEIQQREDDSYIEFDQSTCT